MDGNSLLFFVTGFGHRFDVFMALGETSKTRLIEVWEADETGKHFQDRSEQM